MWYKTPAYEVWAPVVARVLMGIPFLVGAWFKMPWVWYAAQVEQSAAVGIPMPEIAVALAAILEIATGLMLVLGWHTRAAGAVLVPYVLLLTVLFYRNVAEPVVFGQVVSHLFMVGALLYVSVHGAKAAALRED
jgi:putative oxidoreductase